MYATVQDLRDEGVLEVVADDARLTTLLDEAGRLIDQVTGQFFEPRLLVLRLPGRDTPSVFPPYFPIRIDEASIWERPIDPSELDVVGAPVLPGSEGPRVTRVRGVFSSGARNVRLVGLWGYTEADGTALGRTPLAIRRAAMLLVLRWLTPLADEDDYGQRGRRVIAESTRDQSIRYSDVAAPTHGLSEDPEGDALLAPYVRRSGMGAA